MPADAAGEARLRSFLERAMWRSADPDAGEQDRLVWAPIAGDGSVRRLFRVRRSGRTAIAVLNPLAADRPHPDENEAFLAVREYLHRRDVRVPAVHATDLDQGLLLIEDLGDQRLLEAVLSGGAAGLYEETIDALVRMQAPSGPAFLPEMTAHPAYDEGFVLEQEAGYFLNEVARGLAGWNQPVGPVEADCALLARQALHGPRVFMHRDFQSRNLMVLAGAGPGGPDLGTGATGGERRAPGARLAVIDFQGARLGPPEYDLAALLFDPYAGLAAAVREKLASRYRERAHATGVPGVPSPGSPAEVEAIWRTRFLANAADRLMQALGAYAKLGVRFGRPGFREHIPTGLSRLEEVLAQKGDTPALLALVRQIAERMGGEA